jgi:hypothetical protein
MTSNKISFYDTPNFMDLWTAKVESRVDLVSTTQKTNTEIKRERRTNREISHRIRRKRVSGLFIYIIKTFDFTFSEKKFFFK